MGTYGQKLRGRIDLKHRRPGDTVPRSPREVLDDATQDYGVKREGEEIVVSLGLVPPFRIPVHTAIQFALLILAKCGVKVTNDG